MGEIPQFKGEKVRKTQEELSEAIHNNLMATKEAIVEKKSLKNGNVNEDGNPFDIESSKESSRGRSGTHDHDDGYGQTFIED